MFDWVRTRVLRVMRVPHDPEPPFGAPGSVRIFRAGSNYYNLRLCRWGLGQVVGVIGVGVSLYFFSWFKDEVRIVQLASQQVVPAAVPPPVPADNSPAARATAAAKAKRLRQIASFRQIATHTTPWMIILLEIFEAGGVLLFLAQIPVSFAIVRLEFEMHWYIVTDRSLRIRTGVVRLQESTMSFANLQQVEVKQGPLQRLLGLADVRVQSAGGGGDQAQRRGRELDSLHTGIFHSVDNATEIRNLILERLRQFRQAGLGDHDDHHDSVTAGIAPPPAGASDTLAAAQELLAEARALRRVLSPGH